MPSEAQAEPAWIPLERLIWVNRYETAATGEPHGLLNPGLLESAWAKPQNRWAYEGEADLVRLAVALMVGVAQNHPFQQGNKRTGFVGGLIFLELNSFTLEDGLDGRSFADDFVALIAHEIDEAAFAERLRRHVRPHG